jgi:hypothetical protein
MAERVGFWNGKSNRRVDVPACDLDRDAIEDEVDGGRGDNDDDTAAAAADGCCWPATNAVELDRHSIDSLYRSTVS